MIHLMENEWMIFDFPTKIDVSKLYPWIKYKNIEAELIDLGEISYKPLNDIETDSFRFLKADIQYPLIVVSDIKNPHDNKYRMIDGRHRMLKKIMQGESKMLCYVLTYDDISHFIEKL